MTRSDALDAAIAAETLGEVTDLRRHGVVAQLSDASLTIDRLLRRAVRSGRGEALALNEASAAVHRALLALGSVDPGN